MRIDRIVLHNFGSYEGENIFDTNSDSGKNIILIGGKNGAGKTTLFTAMRVCLYGYMSMGYKNQNAFYIRAITKMINNAAKLSKPTVAFVKMRIALSNGSSLDFYDLTRSWNLDESLSETFSVSKNDIVLNSAEIADFEKYLLSIIPPELFNLYFFDGEKIADFFMTEGSNTRIKEAFLTLCGYDTFDIMRRNFKRISAGNTSSAAAVEAYWNAKHAAEEERYEGMGTTVVAASLEGKRLTVANVGDSRLYVAGETMEQITEDHSLVQEMVRIGGINKEEARSHPNKNIITRAVGLEEDLKVDCFVKELEPGNIVLLCSDGLTDMLEDAEIHQLLRADMEVRHKAELLVQQANEHGGRDNIAVIVVDPF